MTRFASSRHRGRLADPGIQPEFRHPERVELLDHLPGRRALTLNPTWAFTRTA